MHRARRLQALDLIEKVLPHSVEAASWMVQQYGTVGVDDTRSQDLEYRLSPDINHMGHWVGLPQGHEYWARLAALVGRKENPYD